MKIASFFRTIFIGIGQIMLQQNAITGVVFWGAVSYVSIISGVGLLLGALMGTMVAYILKYDKENIHKGMYGFSASLVGIATFLFLELNLISCLLMLVGCILATVLQNIFIRRNIPAFTLPFVLVTWGILWIRYILHLEPQSGELQLVSTDSERCLFIFRGFGQIIFQDNIWCGILFFFGVLFSSYLSALCGLIVAFIISIISYFLETSTEDIASGIISYNAILCTFVFVEKQFKNIHWVVLSVGVSLILEWIMRKLAIPILTFPFVLASMIVSMIKNKYQK